MKVPKQLQYPEFRFSLLGTKSKIPIEKEWTTNYNYRYDDLKIKNHDGNIGILGGYGNLLIVDCDDVLAENLVREGLPETMVVQTGSGGYHLYFICNDGRNLKIFKSEKQETLADIQFIGKQVVCPGSTHPNGKRYTVVEDLPIKEIKFKQILYCFKDNLRFSHKKKEKKQGGAMEETDELIKEIKGRVTIQSLLQHWNIDTSRNPTFCPFGHSSMRGACFSYTDEIFHCFHCGSSGSIFHLVMQKYHCDFITARNKLAKMWDIKTKSTYQKSLELKW